MASTARWYWIMIPEFCQSPDDWELLSALDHENPWDNKYMQGTATGFWLRRKVDGTHQAFHDGLVQLLQVYDAAWLQQQKSAGRSNSLPATPPGPDLPE